MAAATAEETKTLTAMRGRYTLALAAFQDSRADELDDLRFMAGSSDNNWQWPSDVLATRGSVQGQTVNARPTLTINKLPQHVRQVTNDQRQNRPAGNVIPVDDKADPEVAQILKGMVRHIEYMSDADIVTDTACDNQVTYGEGYWRILTKYCAEDSFDQDIYLGRIRNSFSVYLDPTIQDPCGADAKWGFIAEEMLAKDYEREYPDASPVSALLANGTGDQGMKSWLNEKTVRIVEYFYFEYTLATLNLYPGNVTAFEGTPEDLRLQLQFPKPLKTRKVQRQKVCWIKSNGYEILDKQEWAGKWIPIVRVVGNEFEVEGQIYLSGLVRNAKDAQRLYNYWCSQEAEMIALAPKAPFIGAGGQFEGYEVQWKTANVQNWPYLEYNPEVTDGSGKALPPPQRAQPPMASSALLQAKLGASDDIKATTGQYDSSIGASSNERTGKAILARERQGDTGTYHYIDNLARAVRHSTRQLIDLIPKIYDTERIARIIGEDNNVSMVKLNPNQQEPVKKIVDEGGTVLEKIYNPRLGQYDVMATTGPNYLTKRQEALEAMATILQSNPQLWSVAGDLFIKNMDWPGAQEMAQRFRATMDPKILEAANSDESPEMQAAKQQIEALSHELDNMHEMLKAVGKSMEAHKNDIDMAKTDIAAYDAETKRIAALAKAMTPEQVQETIMGTIHAMVTSGDLGNMLASTHGGGIVPPSASPAAPAAPVLPAALPSSDVAPLTPPGV